MPWFAPTYNAAPQSTQPVVRLNNETGKREFALMRWGPDSLLGERCQGWLLDH